MNRRRQSRMLSASLSISIISAASIGGGGASGGARMAQQRSESGGDGAKTGVALTASGMAPVLAASVSYGGSRHGNIW